MKDLLRKLQWWVVEITGYSIKLEKEIDLKTFTPKGEYKQISVYKYIRRYRHDNSPLMRRILKIEL